MSTDDRGSTVPLIIGFFVLAMLASAASVAAGQAFVSQRDLQDQCDGMAAAAAAATASVDRGSAVAGGGSLRFADVQRFVDAATARSGSDVHVAARVTDGGQTIRLHCISIVPVVFGAVFGRPHGQRHVVDSSAREPVS